MPPRTISTRSERIENLPHSTHGVTGVTHVTELNQQTITKDKADAALALIEQVGELLQGLRTLKPGQRRSSPMMGPKSERYARGVILSLQQNTEIVPASVNITRAVADLESMDNLIPVLKAWQQMLEHLQDTVYALGSDIMVVANRGFQLMKVLGKAHGLEEITKELSYRHAKSRRKKQTPPAAFVDQGPEE